MEPGVCNNAGGGGGRWGRRRRALIGLALSPWPGLPRSRPPGQVCAPMPAKAPLDCICKRLQHNGWLDMKPRPACRSCYLMTQSTPVQGADTCRFWSARSCQHWLLRRLAAGDHSSPTWQICGICPVDLSQLHTRCNVHAEALAAIDHGAPHHKVYTLIYHSRLTKPL